MCSKPGDTILDPFAGSGTTLVAANILKRDAIGFEVENKYKDEFARRLATEGNIPAEIFEECRNDEEKKQLFLNAISSLS